MIQTIARKVMIICFPASRTLDTVFLVISPWSSVFQQSNRIIPTDGRYLYVECHFDLTNHTRNGPVFRVERRVRAF